MVKIFLKNLKIQKVERSDFDVPVLWDRPTAASFWNLRMESFLVWQLCRFGFINVFLTVLPTLLMYWKRCSKYIFSLSCNRGTFYNIKIIGVKRKCHFQTLKNIFKVPLVVEWGIGWLKIWRLKNIKCHRAMTCKFFGFSEMDWKMAWRDFG